MHCDIYKSSLRDELYVYIARPNYPHDAQTIVDPLAIVPAPLKKSLGRASFVMHLDLNDTKKLARLPIELVKQALVEQGFYLQMPPDGLISPNAVAPEGLRGA